jgi:hypothetical protein
MSKVSKKSYLNIIGLDYIGNIRPIRGVVCFRKPINVIKLLEIMRKKEAFGIVSSHNLYRKKNAVYCKFWCHCYKEPQKYFNKPSICLSESDFVDPSTLQIVTRNKKWDFFYFTMGGELGNEYKGMDLFVDSLPILCGKYNLKGVVVKYSKSKINFIFDKNRKKTFNKYKKFLKIYNKKLSPRRIASLMASSKFGFFPNKTDCSPMLLSESLVRNIPILVNKNILGGWKYVNSETGCFFDNSNLSESIEYMLNNKFNSRSSFMENYGYKNTSSRLAEFGSKYIKSFKKFRAIGFDGSQKTMRAVYG